MTIENVCSVKASTRPAPSDSAASETTPPPQQRLEEPVADKIPLKPLTSLKWPYIPDTSSYDDPLNRDEPKPLKLRDYEVIGKSINIGKILFLNI
jgi:hypothetical protein